MDDDSNETEESASAESAAIQLDEAVSAEAESAADEGDAELLGLIDERFRILLDELEQQFADIDQRLAEVESRGVDGPVANGPASDAAGPESGGGAGALPEGPGSGGEPTGTVVAIVEQPPESDHWIKRKLWGRR